MADRIVKKVIVPGDQIGNNLTGVARKVMTTSKTLTGTGTRDPISVPTGAYEVHIKSGSDIKFYESAGTYVRDGVTYGSGYTGRTMCFPVYEQRYFYLEGSGTVQIMFSSIMEN